MSERDKDRGRERKKKPKKKLLVEKKQLVWKTEAGLLNKSSCLAAAFGVTNHFCLFDQTWSLCLKQTSLFNIPQNNCSVSWVQ